MHELDKCRKCGHACEVRNTHHIQCLGAKVPGQETAELAGVVLHERGVEKGWAIWPERFDPIWVRACGIFVEKVS